MHVGARWGRGLNTERFPRSKTARLPGTVGVDDHPRSHFRSRQSTAVWVESVDAFFTARRSLALNTMPIPSPHSPSRGILLIADITGYTTFLKESELEHAHGVLSDLLSVLVEGTRPPLAISRLEGDAVFSYGIDSGSVGGQTFVEMIEAIYVAFRRAIEQMVLNTRCDCNACANVGGLDLKFIVHHGEFLIQSIGTYRELVSIDVNVAHRLTKNSVTESTGIRAYAVYTAAAVDGLGIAHMTGEWLRHREVYDAGEIECWVVGMSPIWVAARNRSVIEIADSEVRGKAAVEIALPMERVWDRLANPEYRRMLVGSDRQELTGKRTGRLGKGDVFQCYHGNTVVPSVILEWLPFARILTKDLIHVPGATVYLLVDYTLQPIEGGTLLTMACARPTGSALGRAVFPSVLPKLMKGVETALALFKDRVEAEATMTAGLESL